MTYSVGLVEQTASDPVIAAAVARLIMHSKHGDATLVSLPLRYPSGSSVGVRVRPAGDRYVVTDFAVGYREAEQNGLERSFLRHAKDVAQATGIEFTADRQFSVRATAAQLTTAISLVGAASYQAMQSTAAAAPEWDEDQANFEVAQRLIAIYGAERVKPRADIRGASDMSWTVAAKVIVDGRETVFDAVAANHNSVYAASSKFNDLSRLEDAPNRVAMVEDKRAFKKYLGLLSQSAHIIEFNAPDDTVKFVTELAA